MQSLKLKNTAKYFLDSNIFIRFIADDGSDIHRNKAKLIFKSIKSKKINGFTHSLILYEVIYVLIHVYQQSKREVLDRLLQLLKLDNLSLLDVDKLLLISALKNFKKYNIDFPDCLFAEVAKDNDLEILTFDKDFKKLGVSVLR